MHTPLETILAALAARAAVRKSGDGWATRCPAHDDRNPSLSISEGQDGRVLIHCQAGCTPDAVCEALGMTVTDLFPPKQRDEKPRIIAEYDYVDEHGAILFQVCRRSDKQFPQRSPDGSGGWKWGLNGARRVLYHLPKILEAAAHHETIYVVEGEKDVAALEAAGAIATCNPGGAGKWRTEYAEQLRGAREVIIIADRDEPGIAHAHAVAASLGSTPHRILQATTGKDAADHLAAGWSLDFLTPLEPEPLDLPPELVPHAVATITRLDQASDTDPPKPEWLDLFVPHALSAIYGPSGEGKSWITAVLMLHVARLGQRVLVLDYEGPASRLKRRMLLLGATKAELALIDHARPHARLEDHARDLGAGRGLVVVDAVIGMLSTHNASPDQSAEIELIKQAILDPLGADGAAVLTVDHVVKNPDVRGGHATGSERKRGQVDFAYEITAIKTARLRPGALGQMKISVHKDRDGVLEAPAYTATIDATQKPYEWRLRPIIPTTDADQAASTFRPTHLMERVSHYLETATVGLSQNAVERGVTGNARAVRTAIEILIRESYVHEGTGARGARNLTSIQPYREAGDPLSDRFTASTS